MTPRDPGLAREAIRVFGSLSDTELRQVLDFAAALKPSTPPAPPPGPAHPLFGSLAHLGVSISEEEIAEARREMWGNFPRPLPDDLGDAP